MKKTKNNNQSKNNSSIKIVKEKVGVTKRKRIKKNEKTVDKKKYKKGKITDGEEKK